MFRGKSNAHLQVTCSDSMSVPAPAAARSRAMPFTEKQSPRFGVIDTSKIPPSYPNISPIEADKFVSGSISIMP